MPIPDNQHDQPCIILGETDDAISIQVQGVMYWIPLSQVKKIIRRKDGSAIVYMSSWIAEKKGLL